MSHEVLLAERARGDLERLPAFLAPVSTLAAQRAREVLLAAISTLGDFPQRGQPGRTNRFRQLTVPFGGSAYRIRYRVTSTTVLVTRILHAREAG